jgi:hypothetical protein
VQSSEKNRLRLFCGSLHPKTKHPKVNVNWYKIGISSRDGSKKIILSEITGQNENPVPSFFYIFFDYFFLTNVEGKGKFG